MVSLCGVCYVVLLTFGWLIDCFVFVECCVAEYLCCGVGGYGLVFGVGWFGLAWCRGFVYLLGLRWCDCCAFVGVFGLLLVLWVVWLWVFVCVGYLW